MPIYEYECQQCGDITEIYQKTSSKGPVFCENCGSRNTVKLVSAPALLQVANHSNTSSKGTTCCGRTERCDTPPCSVGETCRRDRQ
jgi:putative FmdB family regulatory protein